VFVVAFLALLACERLLRRIKFPARSRSLAVGLS
jgi:hypothetical protein